MELSSFTRMPVRHRSRINIPVCLRIPLNSTLQDQNRISSECEYLSPKRELRWMFPQNPELTKSLLNDEVDNLAFSFTSDR
jgi:hypothetical protein